MRKLLDRTPRRVRGTRPVGAEPRLRTAGIAVVPPRQMTLIRRLNARWMRRQRHSWDRTLDALRDVLDELVSRAGDTTRA